MALTIGIDIGTTSTIGILIDTRGQDARARRAAGGAVLGAAGWAEEDPEQWWGNACAVIGELLRAARARSGERDRGGRRHRHAAGGGPARRRWPPAPPQHPAERRPHRPRGRGAGRRGRSRPRSCSAPATASTSSWSPPSCAGSSGTSRRCSAASRPCSARTTTSTGGSPAMRALEHNWALEAGFLDLAQRADRPELVALGHIEPAAAAAGRALARGDRAGDARGGRRDRPCRRHAGGRRLRRPRRLGLRRRHPAGRATCCSSSAAPATSCWRPTGRGPTRACFSTTTSCRACSCRTAAWPARARC